MKPLKLIWILFVTALVYGAINQWMIKDPMDDSGGPCFAVGFILFMILLLWTSIDHLIEKRARRQRGFEVIQKPSADETPDQHRHD
jgi:hypothetical protein